MAVHDAQFADDRQIVRVMVLGFGGETGNQICADGTIGAQVLEPRNEVYRIAAQVPALHAFEDQVVAGLGGSLVADAAQPLLGGGERQRRVAGDQAGEMIGSREASADCGPLPSASAICKTIETQ